MSITVLIVSYRTGWRLRDCLYALEGEPDTGEVILVDNGNPDPDMAWIDRFCAASIKTRLIRPGANLGFGPAVNLGAAEATGDHLVILNPDAMVKRGALAQLLKAGEGRTTPWLVGGRIFGLDGREQRGARRAMLNWSTALGLKTWTFETDPPPDGPIRVDCVSGAFFMIPRNDFEALGGFDEAYFLHVEDIDLCRRVLAAGGEVIYQPHAGALHAGATSDAPSEKVARHKADSLDYYFRKWARGPGDHLLNALLLPLLTWRVRTRR